MKTLPLHITVTILSFLVFVSTANESYSQDDVDHENLDVSGIKLGICSEGNQPTLVYFFDESVVEVLKDVPTQEDPVDVSSIGGGRLHLPICISYECNGRRSCGETIDIENAILDIVIPDFAILDESSRSSDWLWPLGNISLDVGDELETRILVDVSRLGVRLLASGANTLAARLDFGWSTASSTSRRYSIGVLIAMPACEDQPMSYYNAGTRTFECPPSSIPSSPK